MKKFIALLISSLMILSGCSSQTSEDAGQSAEANQPITINVATLKGPTGMGMAQLMDQQDNGASMNNYNFQILSAPDEIVGKISTGEIDIAAVPTNLAATLYSKTEGNVQMLAINTLGTLYILEKGNSINSVDDLAGKTIVSAGQGSTPEYIINELINRAELSEPATVEYVTEHAEVATKILSGEADVVMVPEPFVTQITSKDSDIRVALDLTVEWKDMTGIDLPMTAVIGRKDFLQENPQAVEYFNDEMKLSVNYLNENPAEASVLVENYDIMPAAVAEKAIPNCNLVYITGEDIKEPTTAYLELLFNSNPKSVGGKLPAEDFFYTV